MFSQELETHVVAGLLKFPEVYVEISSFLSEKDFEYPVNRAIYRIIRNAYEKNEALDLVLVASRVNTLSLSFQENIDVSDYVEALAYVDCTPKTLKQAVADLLTVTKKREVIEITEQIKKKMISDKEMNYNDVISWVDKTFYKAVTSYYNTDDVVDLFETMFERAFERGANPKEEMGLKTPHKMFNEYFGGFMPGNVYTVCARPKQGKAQLVGTKVVTPSGYRNIENLKVGDEVFAVDGTVAKVKNKIIWKNRPVYKVIAEDGAEILVDEQHDWSVKCGSDFSWKKLTTKQIAENYLKKGMGYELPSQGAIQLSEKKLKIDPYILGIWLANETFSKTEFTNTDNFIVNKIKNFASARNLEVSKSGITYKLSCCAKNENKNSFLEDLYYYNLINNKHIPCDYLWASIEQRKAVLQGLIDSHGYVDSKGQVEFFGHFETLSKDVVKLCNSLGVNAKMSKIKSRYRVKFCYEEAAALPKKCKLCQNIEKKQARYINAEFWGKGDTCCIEIDHPSHLYLCGEGMLPTHNSSWLNSTAFETSVINNNIPTLILDTEMQESEIGDRILCMNSGVPLWHIRTGNWSRNPEMVDKIKEAQKIAKEKQYKIWHEYVINCPVEKIVAKIKRWYYTKVGRGNPCMIVYDYIKLTGEPTSEHNKEYQIIGDKINTLKELVGKEVNAPLLTALQLNRAGDNTRGQQNDDSTAIALSDRALWFASYVGIFRRKTIQELEVDTDEFGSHKLITIESRWQGKTSFGHKDYFKGYDNKLYKNFINYDLSDFRAKEICSGEQMHEQLKDGGKVPEKANKKNNDDIFYGV